MKDIPNDQSATVSRARATASLVLRTLVSLAFSGVFVWLSLRQTDLRAVARAMAAAGWLPLLVYLLILLAVHIVRTVRWGLLLERVGHVGFRRLNSASAIGYMMLMVLPLRLGELARPLLVARTRDGAGPQLSRGGAMASCVVERVIDGLAVGAMGVLGLYFVGARGGMADFARHASVLVSAAFSALCVSLIAAFFARRRAVALVRRLVGAVSPRLAARAAWILDEFITALHLGSAWRVLAVLLLTATHWGLQVVGFTLLAPAFGIHLTPLMACAVLASQAAGVMVPAGPGMVGTSQFFTQAGLSIFVPGALSVPEVAARAAGYANCIWMLQFGQQVALGLVFWFWSRGSIGDVLGGNSREGALARDLDVESSVAV